MVGATYAQLHHPPSVSALCLLYFVSTASLGYTRARAFFIVSFLFIHRQPWLVCCPSLYPATALPAALLAHLLAAKHFSLVISSHLISSHLSLLLQFQQLPPAGPAGMHECGVCGRTRAPVYGRMIECSVCSFAGRPKEAEREKKEKKKNKERKKEERENNIVSSTSSCVPLITLTFFFFPLLQRTRDACRWASS